MTTLPPRLAPLGLALTLAALAALGACSADRLPTEADGGVRAPTMRDALTLIVGPTGDVAAALVEAVTIAPDNATIQFDPALAGQTLELPTSLFIADRRLTIEGPIGGITLDGGGAQQVLIVGASANVTLRNLTVTGGRGNSFLQGGGIQSFGNLTLDHVTVSGNLTYSDFIFPGSGGGIRSESGSLTLVNSTVSGNYGGLSGGGIHATGTVRLLNSTIANNFATFGGGLLSNGSTSLEGVVIAGNQGGNCQLGAAALTVGTSVIADASCGTGPDIVVANPLLGPLADNGGGMRTHALLDGSPAIDVAGPCHFAVHDDQRGIARPQGASCDAGAFERTSVTLAVDASGTVNSSTGAATIGGSMTCSGAQALRLELVVSQAQKIRKVSAIATGTAVATVACTGGTERWSVTVAPPSGGFVNAAATARVRALSTDAPSVVERSVKLAWAR